jgi:hypothetical protein
VEEVAGNHGVIGSHPDQVTRGRASASAPLSRTTRRMNNRLNSNLEQNQTKETNCSISQ